MIKSNNSIYYHSLEIHNHEAPTEILPIVFSFFFPASILDVGCGIGTWLKSANDLNIEDLIGIDGSFVDKSLLERNISSNQFYAVDLNKGFKLNRKFDLSICLEVVEHLSSESAETIVESLVDHSKVILFSAAIPGQGGQNHLNEQWPSYWADKFRCHGYVFLDVIRPLIWDNPKVEFWYKQNIFLVVKSDHFLAKKYSSSFLSLVHPELFDRKQSEFQRRIDSLERQLGVHPLKRWLKTFIKFK